MLSRLSRRVRLAIVGVLALGVVSAITVVVLPAQFSNRTSQITYRRPARPVGADWPGYLMNEQNASYNTREVTLNSEAMAHLRQVGAFAVGPAQSERQAIATAVVSVGNTLYFGAWDGYEYAVDAISYALRWRQFLGISTPPVIQQCFPLSAGVSSNATLAGKNLYVGGGDGTVYSLNAATGAVVWRTGIAKPPNEYLWSSPLVANGHVYIGVSSYGDCPLTPGRLVMLDAAGGKVLAIHSTTSRETSGNGIWSKPVLDADDHAVIVAEGNGPDSEHESQSVIALDWNTLQPLARGVWSVPKQQVGGDSDFGTSCVLVPDLGGGRHGVACHNKNGFLYALYVNATGLSLAWSLPLGPGGDGPEHDAGDISALVFDGHALYAATSGLTWKGAQYASAVYRIDPATATVRWVTPIATYFTLNALAGANGFLVMGLTDADLASGGFMVLSADSGATLYSQLLDSAVIAAPTIANGEIYVSTYHGHLYVYDAEPKVPADASLAGTALPAGWQWVSQHKGDATLTKTVLQINPHTNRTVDTADFLAKSTPVGDFTVTAVVDNPLGNGSTRAGVVEYVGTGTAVVLSVFAVTPAQHGFEMVSYLRGKVVSALQTADRTPDPGPVYLQVLRLGTHYYGYASHDGAHWVMVGTLQTQYAPTLVGVAAFAPQGAAAQSVAFLSCQVQRLN
jgi:polyvinyl alcohol dehydrogenase (cytochrome)